jgi:hypothetical protein
MNVRAQPIERQAPTRLTAADRIDREEAMLTQLRQALDEWPIDRMKREAAACEDSIAETLRAAVDADPQTQITLAWWLGGVALKSRVLRAAIEEWAQ